MEVNKETLPKGWTIAKLDDVIIRMTNGANAVQYKEKVGLPISRIETISNETIDLDRVKYIKETDADFIDKYKLRNGDILFSHINSDSHLGKTALFKIENKVTLIHGINLLLLRPSPQILPEIINYQIKYLRAQGKFSSIAQKAVNQSSINQAKLKAFEIFVPPFNEQKHILAKLEQLLTDLDKGIEYLETTKQQLKVYRQAVLKWAFEGNWEIKPLGIIAIVKRGKSKHRPRNAPELFGGKYPFIQTGDVRAANGRVVKEYTETYSDFGLKQSKLWPKGTLCLTIAANIADTAFLGFDACFPDSVVGITSDPNILNLDYVNFYIQKIKQEIEGKASATAQKNINVEFLEALEIPVPNPIKQVKIVHDIESRLSVCEKIEKTIESSLQQAEALRLSIIKKAFEGKLVPQDPNDEPAEQLLERIRALRQSSAKLTSRAQGKQGNGKPEKKEKGKAPKKKALVNG